MSERQVGVLRMGEPEDLCGSCKLPGLILDSLLAARRVGQHQRTVTAFRTEISQANAATSRVISRYSLSQPETDGWLNMPSNTRHHNHSSFGNPTDDRLGWRLPEWMRLTGISRPTLWRQIKRGDLKIVYIGPMPIVPRSEAIRLGLLDEPKRPTHSTQTHSRTGREETSDG